MGAGGDLSVRMHREADDEIGQMALFFNQFMKKLETYNASLTGEIEERKRIEDHLRESEEKHRVMIEVSPEPMVFYDGQGRVRYLNPALFQSVRLGGRGDCRQADRYHSPGESR